VIAVEKEFDLADVQSVILYGKSPALSSDYEDEICRTV